MFVLHMLAVSFTLTIMVTVIMHGYTKPPYRVGVLCGHMSNSSTKVSPKTNLVSVLSLPNLVPNLLALLDLVVSAGPRRGW